MVCLVGLRSAKLQRYVFFVRFLRVSPRHTVASSLIFLPSCFTPGREIRSNFGQFSCLACEHEIRHQPERERHRRRRRRRRCKRAYYYYYYCAAGSIECRFKLLKYAKFSQVTQLTALSRNSRDNALAPHLYQPDFYATPPIRVASFRAMVTLS